MDTRSTTAQSGQACGEVSLSSGSKLNIEPEGHSQELGHQRGSRAGGISSSLSRCPKAGGLKQKSPFLSSLGPRARSSGLGSSAGHSLGWPWAAGLGGGMEASGAFTWWSRASREHARESPSAGPRPSRALEKRRMGQTVHRAKARAEGGGPAAGRLAGTSGSGVGFKSPTEANPGVQPGGITGEIPAGSPRVTLNVRLETDIALRRAVPDTESTRRGDCPVGLPLLASRLAPQESQVLGGRQQQARRNRRTEQAQGSVRRGRVNKQRLMIDAAAAAARR